MSVNDTLTFNARLAIVPSPVSTDQGNSDIRADIQEQLSVQNSMDTTYKLTTDAPVTVAFGSLASATFLMLAPNDLKAIAMITNIDGAAQIVSLDTLLVLISKAAPFTAITLTRSPGILTSVRVVLGEV